MRDGVRSRGGRGPLVWLALVIALLAAGGVFLWSQEARRGGALPEFSVARTDDRGAALAFRLYQKAGLKPQAWDADLTQIRGRGLLILLAPSQAGGDSDLTGPEVVALDRWVRDGNVAVVLSREMNELYRGVGLIMDEPQSLSAKTAEPAQPGVLAQGVSAIKTQTNTGFVFGRKKFSSSVTEAAGAEEPFPAITPIPAEEWARLFVKKENTVAKPQVVSAARGLGLYVAVNDAFLAGNLGMTMADDAQFMLNLARLAPRGGTIWFDQYHLRTPERPLMAYLRERSLTPFVAYVLILVLVAVWQASGRLGEPAPLVADRRRDSAEYIRAVAALYRNAGMTREAFGTIYADFRRRLAGALRMDGLTDLAEVGRRFEQRTGRPALEARQTLVEAEALLARSKLEDAQALAVCAKLTHLDEALHRRSSEREELTTRASR